MEDLARDGQLDPVQQGFIECHGLQCGFCTPGMMMTARWLLDRNPDPAEAEIREVLSGQVCRCTGYENIVRSVRWAAEHPAGTPSMTAGFGRMLRKEDQRFVRGQGTYVDDVHLPGMLYGAVLRSPHPHARIVSIDTVAAEAHPKVKAVITGETLTATQPGLDADPGRRPAGRAGHRQGPVPGPGGGVRGGRGPLRGPGRARADRRGVRAAARGGRRPPRAGPGRPAGPRRPRDPASNHIFDWESGDAERTDQVFRDAEVTVSQDMLYPRVHPAPLETCGIVADFNQVSGKLTVWATSQAPHAHRTLYAMVAGLPEHKIRVISPDIGGGFGNKVPIYPGYLCAITGSMITGRPVKWMEDRSENLMSTCFARDFHMRGELAASRDGKIRAVRVTVLADHGAFNGAAQPTKYPAGFFGVFTGSYDLEAAHCQVTAVYTNKAPGGVAYSCSFRITEAVYLVERMVDVLAFELDIDPAELRMRNLLRPEQFPYTCQTGWAYDSGDYPRTLRLAMDMAGYEDLRKEQEAERARGHLVGIGVSFFTEAVGAGPAQAHGHPGHRHGRRGGTARPPDRDRGAPDLGADPGAGARDHVRADRRRGAGPRPGRRGGRARGHRPDPVRPGHLRIPVHAGVRGGHRDRGQEGARAGQDRGRRHARGRPGRPGVGPAAAGPSRATRTRARTIAEIAWAAHSNLELPDGIEGQLDATCVYNPPNLTYPFGAYICVVDVDPGTGKVDVRRFIAVDDCGVRINPMIVEGQVHGGLADGIGMALMESIAFDADGNCLGGSFMDYLLPTSLECPSWELGATVTPSPHHPIGAKGVGESATVGSPPAVVNAVIDALRPYGVRHADMPLTPAQVWRAIQGRPFRTDLAIS